MLTGIQPVETILYAILCITLSLLDPFLHFATPERVNASGVS